MSTRAAIRFAERTPGQSFAKRPKDVTHQIYHHYDGYPDFLGVAIAKFVDNADHNGTECLAAHLLCKLKLCLHYDKVGISRGITYLEHPDKEHLDSDYTYYIWTGRGDEIWISIFKYDSNECLFVGKPCDLINTFTK